MGGFGFVLSCARDVGLWFVVCLLVRGCGFYLLGCWWWLCPYVGIWFCVLGDFCFGLMVLFLSFRGGAVRFSFFLGAFFGYVCILFWWALAFW